MTAKEKAKELVKKYLCKIIEFAYAETHYKELAKQCALIAVDEILIEYRVLMIETAFCYDQFKYWQEVKQEIERLWKQKNI